ncbi:MAG: alpha/beta fold hydrolase [Steroidobacteraceae bacterium]
MRRTAASLLLLALALAPSAAIAGRAGPARRLALAPCALRSSDALQLVKAECGRLPVAENPADPRGRQIRLAVAVVPAVSTVARPDPLFVLAGGPGEAASTFYASVASAFALIHRDRAIVLVDQRGTGGSNALKCPDGHARGADAGPPTSAEIVRQTEQCLAHLRTHASVRYYTTDLAVDDLDRVRAALGYRQIDLYGSSYGTVVAQEYLRRFPARVRSMILDGVVPPQLPIGAMSAVSAQQALERILAGCAAAASCRARFGDPMSDYAQVSAALAAHPVALTVSDPTRGTPVRMRLTTYQFGQVLRLASYTPALAALLPLDLHAAAGGNYSPLAGQFLLIDRLYSSAVAAGMNNTVVCSEDVPFYRVTAAQRAEMRSTFLGTAPLRELQTVCALWPKGPVGAAFHAPLHSDVPVLLLSGGDDPITPPRYAADAARGYPNSLSVVVPRFGHGQLLDPCMDRIMAQFIARASVAGLNTQCVSALRPMPFFLTLNGPGP